MPIKINKSPLTMDPATAVKLATLAVKAAKGGTKATQEYAAGVRQDLGIEEGQKGIYGGVLKSDEFKDLSFGKKLGILGKGFGHRTVGRIEGMTGIDILPEAKEPEKPTYTTNIDQYGEEILPNQDLVNKGIPMVGKPLKMLTGVNSPITYKMSAAQYKSGLKMSEISGAAPLQSNAFYASLNAAKEKGSDTFNVGGKTFNVK